jgi:hypothetical protein
MVVTVFLSAQIAPDPADLLEQARDKTIERLPPIGYTCTATINRSYFVPDRPPSAAKSCEQIVRDWEKQARYKLKLDKTDRLRLQVINE